MVEANLSFGFYKEIFFYFFGLLETTENGLKRKKNLTFFLGIFFFIFFFISSPPKKIEGGRPRFRQLVHTTTLNGPFEGRKKNGGCTLLFSEKNRDENAENECRISKKLSFPGQSYYFFFIRSI